MRRGIATLVGTEVDVPAAAPAAAETATPEEAEELEPVASVEESVEDAPERVEDDPTGGVPIESADVGDAADAPEDTTAFDAAVEEAAAAPGPTTLQADDEVEGDRYRA